MSQDVVRPWTAEQVKSDEISKKQIVEFLQEHASSAFLKKNKLNGKLANVVKSSKKGDLEESYEALFASKEFRNEKEEEELGKLMEQSSIKEETKEGKKEATGAQPQQKTQEAPKYKKTVSKSGDRSNFPKKGDNVSCRFKGMLENGTVFSQNMDKEKNVLPPVLQFKVGTGKVIRGWDEAMITMSVGEKARLVIQPEWTFGKKGKPESNIPANSTLVFDVELLSIDSS